MRNQADVWHLKSKRSRRLWNIHALGNSLTIGYLQSDVDQTNVEPDSGKYQFSYDNYFHVSEGKRRTLVPEVNLNLVPCLWSVSISDVRPTAGQGIARTGQKRGPVVGDEVVYGPNQPKHIVFHLTRCLLMSAS